MKRSVNKKLLTRTITGFYVVVLTVLFFIFSYNLTFTKFCTGLINAFVVYEIFKATDSRENEFWQVVTSVFCFVLPFVDVPYYSIILLIAFVVAIITAICMMANSNRFNFRTPSSAILFCIVISLFFSSIPNLRTLNHGFYYLLLPIVICVITDIFAYLVGRKWGQTLLSPKVSPKKTVEGSVAGLVISYFISLVIGLILHFVVGGVIVNFKIFPWYALLCSAVGQFGDLTASIIKRIARVKDFGTLLPGHGGILDRLDSVSFGLALTYIFYSFGGAFLL